VPVVARLQAWAPAWMLAVWAAWTPGKTMSGFLSKLDTNWLSLSPSDTGWLDDSNLNRLTAGVGNPLGYQFITGNSGLGGTPTEKGTQDRWAIPGITDFSHNYGAETAALIAAGMYGAGGSDFGGGETAGGGEAGGGFAGSSASDWGFQGGGGANGELSGEANPSWLRQIPNALSNISNLFGGGGNQQQPQPRFNPFSPAQPLSPESPYHPMNFGNESFTPWMQNVASMEMPKQLIPSPAEHIFAQGRGFF